MQYLLRRKHEIFLMKIKILLFILTTFSITTAETARVSRLYLSVISEATAFPSYKVIRLPIHPGFSVGVNCISSCNGRHLHALTVEGAYFYDGITGHCILLYPEYRFEYRILKLFLETDIGLGYKHNIFSRPVYKMVDDTYEQVTDRGTPQVMLPIGLGLGYMLPHGIHIFMQYKWIAAFPFNIKAGLPLMPHTVFHLGTSLNLPCRGNN